MKNFPALQIECFDKHIAERLQTHETARILILYGSVRERSYSRSAGEKTFNPSGLPLPDDAPETHLKL